MEKTLLLLTIKTLHELLIMTRIVKVIMTMIYETMQVDETVFMTRSSTDRETTSTLLLRHKVKREKLATLHRHLNVTGDLDLITLNQFN